MLLMSFNVHDLMLLCDFKSRIVKRSSRPGPTRGHRAKVQNQTGLARKNSLCSTCWGPPWANLIDFSGQTLFEHSINLRSCSEKK